MEFASNGMKYKPFNRKRHKPRPITDLVPHSKHILINLLEGSNNVNAIFRKLQQTGLSYKRDVLDCICYLEQGKLIVKSNSPRHSTKKIMSLTDMGKNIAQLIVNTEKYIQSLSELHKAIIREFDISFLNDLTNPNELRKGICEKNKLHTILKKSDRMLEKKGWTQDERIRFAYDNFNVPHGITYVLDESPKQIFNILLYKYQILLQFSGNDVTKKLIQKVVIDLITDLLHYVHVKHLRETEDVEGVIDFTTEMVLDHTVGVSHIGAFMYHFMNKYVMELFDSMFSVVEPRRGFIGKRIDTQIDWTRKTAKKKYDQTWDDAEIYMDQSTLRVIPFYEKISKKWD